MVGRTRTLGDTVPRPGDGDKGIARRLASGKSLKEKALLAAKLAVAVLLAQLAFAAYAGAGVASSPSPNPPAPAPTAPEVVRTIPTNGAMGVDRDRNIQAKFSEAMTAGSVNTTTVRLWPGNLTYDDLNGDGCPLNDPNCAPAPLPPPLKGGYTVKYVAAKKLAILNPSDRLGKRKTYTAVVEGAGDEDGASVKDRDGNPMARDKIWHFKTGRK